MKLKEWLEIHKDDDYTRVYYTRREGTYKRDSFGKLYVAKELRNNRIDYTKNKMYLECDIVKEKVYESEAIDPIFGHREKIMVYECWLDNDQVNIVIKGGVAR